MLYYTAFHLRIGSEIPLPEFLETESGGDVEVRLQSPQRVTPALPICWDAEAKREARFCYLGAGQFVVQGGHSVIITPEPKVDLPLLRLYVQGMMFATLLHQRGLFVLHASVVQIGGSAIAFVGAVGAGKSTLAAGFHARGCAVLADDNAAIDLQHSPPQVLPAFPAIKIYPEVAASLGYMRAGLQPMHASQLKQAQMVANGFTAESAPLRAVYVLDREQASDVQRLSPVESMVELIRHSVPTRWGVPGDAAHLKVCSRFAGRVDMYRTRTFHSLDEIPPLLDRIEGHVAHLTDVKAERVPA